MLDVVTLMKRLEGDVELLEELCDAFPACADEELERLRLAVAARNLEHARTAAHSLKGMFLNLAASEPANQAKELEDAVRQLQWERAEQMLPRLAEAIERLGLALTEVVAEVRRVP